MGEMAFDGSFFYDDLALWTVIMTDACAMVYFLNSYDCLRLVSKLIHPDEFPSICPTNSNSQSLHCLHLRLFLLNNFHQSPRNQLPHALIPLLRKMQPIIPD